MKHYNNFNPVEFVKEDAKKNKELSLEEKVARFRDYVKSRLIEEQFALLIEKLKLDVQIEKLKNNKKQNL